jgi:hypothetical protein
MKKALIFQNKVVDVAESEFEVHESMSWMDCPDDCVSGHWELKNGELQVIPKEVPPYNKRRAREYPSIGDQLDMLMKDMKDGTTTHQTACEAVKAKYPKPS